MKDSVKQHVAINAHLLASSAGYRSAGIHRYMLNTLLNMPAVDERYQYTVLLNHQREFDSANMQTQLGAFDTSWPARRIFWEQAVQPFALRQLKPDLYHAMAFVAPWHVPAPFVVTVYDLSFIRFPHVLSRARRAYLHNFTDSSCRRAARVIAISHSTAHDLTELMGISPEKIDVAPPGVEPDFQPLPPDEIERFRKTKGLPQRFLLFIGTLEPRKNLPMLLRAYAGFTAEERKAMHLVIGGGKGWMYEDIFATIETHHLSSTVHLPGFIPTDELVLWYNAATAFVYPTIFEGFGIPILEAMACGKPVLASNTSSLPEAAGDAGFLLPPDDEAAWAAAMKQTLYDEDWREQATRKSQQHVKKFTWEYTAQQTVESYHRVLEK